MKTGPSETANGGTASGERPPPESPAGIACSVAAYLLWGLFPIYFKAVAAVPALQVLAHRIVCSLLLLAIVTAGRQGWTTVLAALRSRRLLATLMLSATAIALNWGIFIWAVAAGRVLECSLGYFVTPLVNVLLGVALLGERLRRIQWLAVAMAVAGVCHQIIVVGTVPWVALALAVSFGSYGLLRKTARIDATSGLFVEALLLTPPALAFLIYLAATGGGAFATGDWRMDILLVAAGPLTALPLILFVAAARRLRLTTVGLLQYITPTGQLFLAVAIYHEPFAPSILVTFACIWAALAVYSVDMLRGAPSR